jgi:predicted acylesterase/phospholipase RssA
VTAVDVVRPHLPQRPDAGVPRIADTLLRATVLGSLHRPKRAKVVIAPEVGDIGLLEFTALDQVIESGRAAARSALAEGIDALP